MGNLDISLNNLVSFSDFNKGQAGKIFESVKSVGKKLVVKNNNPECVLVSVEEYMEMVDQMNELKLLLMATERLQNFDDDIKNSFSQEEIEKMFGIDTNDADGVDIEWSMK